MQLYVRSCKVINAEITVVVAVPIENPADSGARCYSFSAGRWDLRLSCQRGKLSCGIVLLHDNARPHTARQIISTMDSVQQIYATNQTPLSQTFRASSDTSLAAWAIPLGHLRASSVQSEPGTVAGYFFSCFQKWRSTLMVNASQMMTWRMLSADTWSDEGTQSGAKCLNVKGDYVE